MNPVVEQGTRYDAVHGRTHRRALPSAYISRADRWIVEHAGRNPVGIRAHVAVDALDGPRVGEVPDVVVQPAVGADDARRHVQVILENRRMALELVHGLVDLREDLEEHCLPRSLHGGRRGKEHSEDEGDSETATSEARRRHGVLQT